MKTLYFECNMGAAGDMLTAALLELHPDPEGFLRRLNALGIPHTTVSAHSATSCGITGTHVTVTVDGAEEHSEDVAPEELHAHHHAHEHSHEHEHEHTHARTHSHEHEHEHTHAHTHHAHAGMHDISHIISHLALSDAVRAHVLAVYQLIAEAESHAHGKPVSDIHLHEVGTMDAVADIVAVCMLIDELAPDRIVCSPIHVGSGQVRCAHGILPVPAPATAYILRGVPTYGGSVRGELCTPTGAALLRHFVAQFGAMPVMAVSAIGYGMGSKEFEAANCVRAMLGETESDTDRPDGDMVYELRCNLDDMTAEAIGFAAEQLFAGGALDVTTSAVQMKKNRPGTQLTCLCRPEQREQMTRLLFAHTTTLGIREYPCRRSTLARTQRVVQTPHGSVRIKRASGWGVVREKAEYDDIADIARRAGMSFAEATELVRQCETEVQ